MFAVIPLYLQDVMPDNDFSIDFVSLRSHFRFLNGMHHSGLELGGL